LKIAFLLPFTNENKQNANTERFTEFYRGALLALEDVKTQGFTANIQTFDTGFGTSSFYRILSEKFFEDVDLIVGPAYPEQVSVVAAFAKKHKIVQVVPFTSKIDKADKHEYLYQFNPATEDIAQVVADDFIEKFSKHNIVFVNFADKDGKGAKFADVLRKNLKNKAIKYQDIFADDAVENALKGKNSILVFATSNYENFSKIFQNLNNPNTNDLKFWVTEEISEKLPEIKNIYSYSLFNNNVSKNYLQRYEKWFGLRSCKSVPCYDLLGYDITSYFCNADFNPLTSTFSNSNSALFLQSNFDFSMQKNGKGYLNYGYFLNCDFCKQ
jgi:hypothetical protein